MSRTISNFSTKISLNVEPDLYLDLRAMALVKKTEGYSTIARFGLNQYMTALKEKLTAEELEVFEKVRGNLVMTENLEKQILEDDHDH